MAALACRVARRVAVALRLLLLLVVAFALVGVQAAAAASSSSGVESVPPPAVSPTFDRQSENVTATIGSAVVLPCFISNLGDHKVAWIKVASMDILAIGDYKISSDERITLMHTYANDWSIGVQPVGEEDAGEYICQVNTEPQIISRIHLHVLLPPKIIEEQSTTAPSWVREGDSVTLYCHAEGVPTPTISWYFRKRTSSSSASPASLVVSPQQRSNNHQQQQQLYAQIPVPRASSVATEQLLVHVGSTLSIANVTRAHSGAYECIANNSVPPAASRKLRLSVEFGPEVKLHTHKLDQLVGHDVRLECKIKANPLVSYYWKKDEHIIATHHVNGLDGAAAVLVNASGEIVTVPHATNHHHHQQQQQHKHHRHAAQHQQQHQHRLTAPYDNKDKYEFTTYLNPNGNDYLTVSTLLIKNLAPSDLGVYECLAANAHSNNSKATLELKERGMDASSLYSHNSREHSSHRINSNHQQQQLQHHAKNRNDNTRTLVNGERQASTRRASPPIERETARPAASVSSVSSSSDEWSPASSAELAADGHVNRLSSIEENYDHDYEQQQQQPDDYMENLHSGVGRVMSAPFASKPVAFLLIVHAMRSLVSGHF